MEIAVMSQSAGWHARHNVTKCLEELGTEYVGWHKRKNLEDYDVIYCIGWYISSMQSVQNHFDLLNLGKPVIIHWAGSDVTCCEEYIEESGDKDLLSPLNESNVVNICQRENMVSEVKALGVKDVEIVSIASRLDCVVTELDAKPNGEMIDRVSVYMPPGRVEFFNYPMLERVAEKLPDVLFILHSLSSTNGSRRITENIVDWGKQTDAGCLWMQECCNLSLRIVPHDGMSLSVIESCLSGRRVITNQDYPFTFKVEADVDSIVDKINELRVLKEPHTEAANYYTKNHGKAKYYEDFVRQLGKLGVDVKA